MSIYRTDVEPGRINSLKVVFVKQNRNGKWLVEQLGKNEATVSRWCSNKMQPFLDTFVRISELLYIDVKDLIVSNKA